MSRNHARNHLVSQLRTRLCVGVCGIERDAGEEGEREGYKEKSEGREVESKLWLETERGRGREMRI